MSKLNQVPVITIDGPSGTGKGTISQMLAQKLEWHYLDSGAIYRVLAYSATRNKIKFNQVDALVQLATVFDLTFSISENLITHVFLDGDEITTEIRQESCGERASIIAAIPEIRAALIKRQRAFATMPGLVTDGRDMGTTIFPDAKIKIFLTASVEERAKRRSMQLKKVQNDVNLAQVVEQLTERDARDSQRSCSPLLPAKDAIEVDTTELTIDQVFRTILDLVHENI